MNRPELFTVEVNGKGRGVGLDGSGIIDDDRTSQPERLVWSSIDRSTQSWYRQGVLLPYLCLNTPLKSSIITRNGGSYVGRTHFPTGTFHWISPIEGGREIDQFYLDVTLFGSVRFLLLPSPCPKPVYLRRWLTLPLLTTPFRFFVNWRSRDIRVW